MWICRVLFRKELILFFLFTVNTLEAQEDKYLLKGIKSIGIVLEVFQPDMIENGLSFESIKAKLELICRSNGIKISDGVGEGYLYVNINALFREEPFPLANYSYSLEFKQQGTLIRNKKFFVGSTWSIGGVGYCSRNDFNNKIKEVILDKMDIFINEFLAVNKK